MEQLPIRETECEYVEHVSPVQSLSFDLFDEETDQNALFETRTRLSSTCKINRPISKELAQFLF